MVMLSGLSGCDDTIEPSSRGGGVGDVQYLIASRQQISGSRQVLPVAGPEVLAELHGITPAANDGKTQPEAAGHPRHRRDQVAGRITRIGAGEVLVLVGLTVTI